jgi:Cu-Zn family superoxide dismutase
MHLRHVFPPLAAALLAASCATAPTAPYVVATLEPTRGNTASGTVWFSQQGSEVRVRGSVSGLKPNQEHGFHVHEKGDCSSGDGMSSGGHLNPDGKPHGPPTAAHHAGDLPALKADASGTARVDARVAGTVLGPGPGDMAGKALIVHASPDDYTTQPTGNSGARIACGVISTTAGRDAAGREVPLPREM